MIFNGVEILKLQFSRAVEQTFEQFLDSWSIASHPEQAGVFNAPHGGEFPVDIPVTESI
jgi:hypothetical protein